MPEVIFNGPEGRLQGRYHHSKTENAPVALILHPHPEHGGNMNNRIVYALFHAYVKRNFSVLRFNYRGVGRSQGQFDNGQGELTDAACALDWMQSFNQNAKECWVAGYSFGAWIGMQLMMRRPEISGFISIAPPASQYDFTFLAPCPSSGLFVHGSEDEIIPEESSAKLAAKISSQKNVSVDYRVIKGAGHFFQDQLAEMNNHVEDYMDIRLAETST